MKRKVIIAIFVIGLLIVVPVKAAGTFGCTLLAGEFIDFVSWIFQIIQIAGMALTFILGIVDFLVASASGNDDAMGKAGKKFSIRIMALTILMILPALLNFILGVVKMGVISKDPVCGIEGL